MRASSLSGLIVVLAVCVAGCGGGGATSATGEKLTPEDAYRAAESGDLDTVMLALDNGTLEVNDTDATGRTLLHYAAAGGQREIVYRLVEEYQADATIRDSSGQTALAYARQNGDPQIYDKVQRAGGAE